MQGSYYSWPERGKMFTKVIQLLNTAIEQNITFSNHISNKIQEDTAFEWTQKGLLRFYYSEMFNTESRTLESLNVEAKNFEPPPGSIQDFPMLDEPLNMLDVFAGCGGLSIGLEQSGVAITKWAIEWEKDAAKAFKVSFFPNFSCRFLNPNNFFQFEF